jgi:hypothetical protein
MTPVAPQDPITRGSNSAGVNTIAERACYQAGERARPAARGIDLAGEPACRECGCTDSLACPQGCSWMQPDLCSVCAAELDELADPLAIPTHRAGA